MIFREFIVTQHPYEEIYEFSKRFLIRSSCKILLIITLFLPIRDIEKIHEISLLSRHKSP